MVRKKSQSHIQSQPASQPWPSYTASASSSPSPFSTFLSLFFLLLRFLLGITSNSRRSKVPSVTSTVSSSPAGLSSSSSSGAEGGDKTGARAPHTEVSTWGSQPRTPSLSPVQPHSEAANLPHAITSDPSCLLRVTSPSMVQLTSCALLIHLCLWLPLLPDLPGGPSDVLQWCVLPWAARVLLSLPGDREHPMSPGTEG